MSGVWLTGSSLHCRVEELMPPDCANCLGDDRLVEAQSSQAVLAELRASDRVCL